MASPMNSEFNYRYQVIGHTVWEKIKTLKNFLEGRKRAMATEQIGDLKVQAVYEELKHAEATNAPLHTILRLKADIAEIEASKATTTHIYELTRREIANLEKLLAELYELAEPTRIEGYDDDQMFELNAANEFTMMIAKEIQCEIIANGRPSPAKLLNAMSNPYTFAAIKSIGLIPNDVPLLEASVDPLQISLTPVNKLTEINHNTDFLKISVNSESSIVE
jgi:hypothetical protein